MATCPTHGTALVCPSCLAARTKGVTSARKQAAARANVAKARAKRWPVKPEEKPS